MEQLQNFGPNDVQNGTLTQMFRNAGINDIHTYVDDIRQENFDLNEQLTMDKPTKKSRLENIKQIYQMYKSFDKNGDGKITVEDVEILLKQMGLGFISKHLAQAIFNIVDTNHNGQLDFRDLIALTSLLKQLSNSTSSSSSQSVRF